MRDVDPVFSVKIKVPVMAMASPFAFRVTSGLLQQMALEGDGRVQNLVETWMDWLDWLDGK